MKHCQVMPTLDFVIKLCLVVPKLTLAGLIILSAAQGGRFL